ncbi:hypothetical protein [Kangiella spongicola]|uniref:Uncharacterized protein n=1 Tax=Kangiella spongicola TaxID=796379 RepID=A0A318DDH2_9GAMM|nr:hypothetical protein [Kangiella spongicola]PXF64199.1 hypothetical protein DL796_03420 [Kangiella spongicola]
MSPNIKKLTRCLIPRSNAIDLKEFKILFYRSNHILLGTTILAALMYLLISDSEFVKFIYDSVNYRGQLYEQYLSTKESINSLHGKGTFNTSFEKFLDDMKGTYIHDLVTLIIMCFVILIPWLLYLFWPQRCPVRVDKERQLIYTWRWGKLYASRFDALNPEKKETAHFLEIRGGWGPLVISLYPAGSNKAKRVSIGSYIPKFNYQNHQLLDFIRNYLSGFATIPSDFKPERGFLEKTLVKNRSFPEDTKLNKAIDHWLAKESK